MSLKVNLISCLKQVKLIRLTTEVTVANLNSSSNHRRKNFGASYKSEMFYSELRC